MTPAQDVLKALRTHRIDPDSGELHQDRPGLTQKCSGCPWIGWDHDEHVAEVVAKLVSPLITTVEELEALAPGDEISGALIKCIGIVNPDSGRYDCGEVYEQNADETWGILCTPGYNGWEDRAVLAKDLVLPAVLLWEPERQR